MNHPKLAYRVFATLMALLVLTTSTGVAMDLHYCRGNLKTVSFFGKAKTCHEMKAVHGSAAKQCPMHANMARGQESCSEDKNCCSNKTVFLQSDQDVTIQSTDFVPGEQFRQFVQACIAVFFNLYPDFDHAPAPYARYKPPLEHRDIPVLNQAFLL